MIHEFASVTDAEVDRLRRLTGIDFSGYVHSLDGSAVLHILARHGHPKVPPAMRVQPDDFVRLPLVIQADSSPEIVGLGRSGELRIRYSARVNGYYFVVEEVRRKQGRLAVVTMWKSSENPKKRKKAD